MQIVEFDKYRFRVIPTEVEESHIISKCRDVSTSLNMITEEKTFFGASLQHSSIRICNPKDRLLLRIANAHTQFCRIANPAGQVLEFNYGLLCHQVDSQ